MLSRACFIEVVRKNKITHARKTSWHLSSYLLPSWCSPKNEGFSVCVCVYIYTRVCIYVYIYIFKCREGKKDLFFFLINN